MPPVGRSFGSCYDQEAEMQMKNESFSVAKSKSVSEANSDNDVENEINVNVVVNSDDSEDDTEEKVQVCHNGETIEISVNALPTHLDHGDTYGPCETLDETADTKSVDVKSEAFESAVEKTESDVDTKTAINTDAEERADPKVESTE